MLELPVETAKGAEKGGPHFCDKLLGCIGVIADSRS